MQRVSRQKVRVVIDEVERQLQAGERVGTDILTAERLNEREEERDAGVAVARNGIWPLQFVRVVGARGQRDGCEEKAEKKCRTHCHCKW